MGPELFRLLSAIAKIAFITTRIIVSLDFISAVQYTIHFIYHFVYLATVRFAGYVSSTEL